jgi:hypothetical protein
MHALQAVTEHRSVDLGPARPATLKQLLAALLEHIDPVGSLGRD